MILTLFYARLFFQIERKVDHALLSKFCSYESPVLAAPSCIELRLPPLCQRFACNCRIDGPFYSRQETSCCELHRSQKC